MEPCPIANSDIFAHSIDTKLPPSTISQRDDHPVPRKGIFKKAPIGTNNFYSNFYLDDGETSDQTTPCYTHPYVITWLAGKLRPDSWGMAISHSEKGVWFWGPDSYNKHANDYFGSPVGIYSIIISSTNLGPGTTLTTSSITAFSAMVHIQAPGNQSPTISFPVVQGMGFVSANYYGTTPLFQTNVLFKSLAKAQDGTNIGISKFIVNLMDNTTWYIYAVSATGSPLCLTLTSQSEIQATSNFYGVIQVAKETNNGKAESIYNQTAGAYPVSMRLSGSVKAQVGEYTFTWHKAGHQRTPLLIWALPHHVQSFDAKTTAKITCLRAITTVKGTASAVLADSWTLIENSLPINMGFTPWDPERGSLSYLPEKAKAKIFTIAQHEVNQDILGLSGGPSMYFSGKVLAKFAQMIYVISELLDSKELGSAALDRLKEAFARFKNNTQDEPLVYESAWGGVVTSAGYRDAGQDFGAGYYNDHHFHYGYHILSAAIIAFLDPKWLEETGNKDYVNSLARDYANPSVNDACFPQWRSFDWYHGHSWAHGLFATRDGKNQESSSEDVMAAYALKMWGAVTGDANLESRSNLQLSVLARSLRHYYLYDSDNDVVPPTFAKNKVAGILFENKIDHTTFFGRNIEFIHGIHMLPLIPATLLTRSRKFVREEWKTWFSEGRVDKVDGGWKGILYGNLATIDPQAAWNFFAKQDFNATWIDGGASRTWYLVFAATLAGEDLVLDGGGEKKCKRCHCC